MNPQTAGYPAESVEVRSMGDGRRAGVPRLHGDVLRENEGMLRFANRFGFETLRHPDGAWLARVTISLLRPPSAVAPRPEAIRHAPAPA